MNLFGSRYKRYAAWHVVLWCRLRGHPLVGTFLGRFHSGGISRCVDCGDSLSSSEMFPPKHGARMTPDELAVLMKPITACVHVGVDPAVESAALTAAIRKPKRCGPN